MCSGQGCLASLACWSTQPGTGNASLCTRNICIYSCTFLSVFFKNPCIHADGTMEALGGLPAPRGGTQSPCRLGWVAGSTGPIFRASWGLWLREDQARWGAEPSWVRSGVCLEGSSSFWADPRPSSRATMGGVGGVGGPILRASLGWGSHPTGSPEMPAAGGSSWCLSV